MTEVPCVLGRRDLCGTHFCGRFGESTNGFDGLRQAGVKLKPKKRELFRKRVGFLGHVVSEDGIRCDPAKVEAMEKFRTTAKLNGREGVLGSHWVLPVVHTRICYEGDSSDQVAEEGGPISLGSRTTAGVQRTKRRSGGELGDGVPGPGEGIHRHSRGLSRNA
jgi:hypothetical protein